LRDLAEMIGPHRSRGRGAALQSRLVRAIEPYARCHRACVVFYPLDQNAILPMLFPKEPVPASPHPPRLKAAGTTCSEGATMTVSLLTLAVVLVVFGVWLMADPPVS